MRNVCNEVIGLKLKRDRFIEVVLFGESMLPLLQPGDTVLVESVEKTKKGDLCLFELPDGSLGVHRVVGCTEDFILMKGDNCMRVERTERDRVLGNVCGVFAVNSRPVYPLRSLAYSAASYMVAFLSSLNACSGSQGVGVVCKTKRARFSLFALRMIDDGIRRVWLKGRLRVR